MNSRDATPGTERMPRRWLGIGLKAGALLIPPLCLAGFVAMRSHVDLPEGVSRAEYGVAADTYRHRHGRDGDYRDVMALLGQQAIDASRFELAAVCLREIPSDHPEHGFAARFQQAQVHERLNQVEEAEMMFRECLAMCLADLPAREEEAAVCYNWLAFLLSVELRFEDRKEILRIGHDTGLARIWDSRLYYFPHLLIWNSPDGRTRLERYLEHDPQNLRLRLGLARYLTMEGDYERAGELLVELTSQHPGDRRCAAARLEFCYELADWDAFARVIEPHAEFEEGEPWLLTRLRGEFDIHHGRWREAIGHFERVLINDPSNPWSHAGLARAYGGLQQEEDREATLLRSLALSRLRDQLSNANEDNPAGCRELAGTCDQLGFDEAAEVFRNHALRIESGRESNAFPLLGAE